MLTDQEIKDAERRILVDHIIAEIKVWLCDELECEPKDLSGHMETWRVSHKYRLGLVRIQWTIALSLLGIAIAGFGNALWLGFKGMLK